MTFSVSASLFSRYLSLAWAYSTQFIQSKSLTSSSVGALGIGAFVVLASIVCCLSLTVLRVTVVFVGAVMGFCAIFSSPNSTTISTSVQISFDNHQLPVAWCAPYYPIKCAYLFNHCLCAGIRLLMASTALLRAVQVSPSSSLSARL